MMMTLSHQKKISKSFAIMAVVVAGWTFGLFTTAFFVPDNPITHQSFYQFYFNACLVRIVLFVISFLVIYNVGGSKRIAVLMSFNVAAFGMNVGYMISYDLYHLIYPFRKPYFSTAYTLAEFIIFIWAGWDARRFFIYHGLRVLDHAVSAYMRLAAIIKKGAIY